MQRDNWLEARLDGIGASEAAAVLGLSPYMSNEELWEIKTRRRTAEDIGAKSYVKYGNDAEPHLRAMFALDYPQYIVEHEEYEMIWHPRHKFIFATPDGKLTERSTGRRGMLEIKTTEIFRPGQWDQWDDRIPQHYYIQVVHQLLATQWDFAYLKARIRSQRDGEIRATIKHYPMTAAELAQDMAYLLQEEIKFWDCVVNDRRPPRKLPRI